MNRARCSGKGRAVPRLKVAKRGLNTGSRNQDGSGPSGEI
jgi:hypothetical protein